MSSNIRVQRVCNYCQKEFEAKKTTSKTCSEYCAKRLYKEKQKAAKIARSNEETLQVIRKPIEDLRQKEFLTVKEVAKLLGFSLRTTYRAIEQGNIKAVNLAERKTLIKRSEIDKLFS